MDSNHNLQFKILIKKTVMLFIILGALRKQNLFTLTTENIMFKENKVVFLPNKTMKYTKPNTLLGPLIYQHYPEIQKLCIVKCLKSSIGMRNALVGEEIKDLLLVSGSLINQFHMRKFQGGLKVNLEILELTLLFSKLVAAVQHPLAKQRTLVFH